MPGETDPLVSRRQRNGLHFRYVTPARDECARIRFSGRFRGKEVIWDTTVLTLAYYHRCLSGGKGNAATVHDLRQFIEVGASGAGNRRRLVVALNVPRIDVPTLLKTIIMIRKYKRLDTGRHEYGPAWSP